MKLSKTIIYTLLAGNIVFSTNLSADDHHEKHEKDEIAQHEQGRKTLTEAQKQAFVQKAKGDKKVLPSVSNKNWSAECASCHGLYHPSLLPARSWVKIMGTLDKHFGDVATLTPSVNKDILNFLVANSAEKADNVRSKKILDSIPTNATPLRISETPYIQKKHHDINKAYFKREKIGSRANCFACHTTADQGYYSEKTVIIPK